MNDTVGIAVVSYAHLHAPRYTASIAAHPQARLVAIVGYGENADVAQQAARHYGVPFCARLEDLEALPGVDAVYLASEPVDHRELVAWAAAHGWHILCDKPLATTLEDAAAIVCTARQAGVKLMVPFNPRYQLPVQRIKADLERGDAGELISITAFKYGKLPARARGPQRADWFLDPQRSGGGGFLDIGIHALDALRWLSGSEPRWIYARVGAYIHPDQVTEDLGTVLIEFENGVLGALTAGWVNPDGFPTWLDVGFEVLTTRRAYQVYAPYHTLTLYRQPGMERRAWWRRDVDGLVDEFVRAILEDREPAITGEDGFTALAMALAAYASSQRAEPVDFRAWLAPYREMGSFKGKAFPTTG